jgi:hypothetical protein
MRLAHRPGRAVGIRAFWLAAAALLLAACSTLMYRGSGYDYGMRLGQGLAIVTVSVNGAPVWPTDLPERQPPFAELVFEKAGAERVQLPATSAPHSIAGTSTVAFYADVLPGDYRLSEFRWTEGRSIAVVNPYTGYVIAVPLSKAYRWPIPPIARFEVKAGQVTYLGHLVFHEDEPGKPAFRVSYENDPRVGTRVLSTLLPRVADEVEGAEPLTWKDPDWENGAATRRAIAGSSEFVLNPRRQPDGSVLAGSCVGQVLERSAAGKWIRHDTGVSQQIRSVVRLSDHRLLAGGELGVLRLGNAAGSQWSGVDFPGLGVVEWLGQRPDGSLMALVGDDKATTLLRTPTIDTPRWSELARIEHPRIERPGVGALRDARIVQQHGDLLGILLADGRVAALDLATATFRVATKLQMLKNLPPLSASIAADGTMTVLHRGIPKQATSVSRDGGSTWQTTTLLLKTGYVTRLHHASSERGFRFLLPNLDAASVKVQATADAGKTWRDVVEMPHLRYVWELGDGHYLGSAERMNGRAVWLTEDAGQTWRREELPMGDTR